MIFMTHPSHGAMRATHEAEAKTHEARGWKRSTEDDWLGDKGNDHQPPAIVLAEEVTEAPKRRGRPPKA